MATFCYLPALIPRRILFWQSLFLSRQDSTALLRFSKNSEFQLSQIAKSNRHHERRTPFIIDKNRLTVREMFIIDFLYLNMFILVILFYS